MGKFPVYRQLDQMDCGPTCLRLISAYFGRRYTLDYLRQISEIGKEGVSMKSISDGAEKIGLRSKGVSLTFQELDSEATLPAILYWRQNHFVVLPPPKL